MAPFCWQLKNGDQDLNQIPVDSSCSVALSKVCPNNLSGVVLSYVLYSLYISLCCSSMFSCQLASSLLLNLMSSSLFNVSIMLVAFSLSGHLILWKLILQALTFFNLVIKVLMLVTWQCKIKAVLYHPHLPLLG